MQKFYFAGHVRAKHPELSNSAKTLSPPDASPLQVLVAHLGSTSATANADGSLNSVIQYTAYGEIRLTQGVTPTKYRYTSQLAQAELGLDYYVARWYDPVLGHYTQADSIIPEPGKSQGFDRYAYSSNNPVKYTDPSGHDAGGALAMQLGLSRDEVLNLGGYSNNNYNSSKIINRQATTPTAPVRNLQTPSIMPVPQPTSFETITPTTQTYDLKVSTPTPTQYAPLSTEIDDLHAQFIFQEQFGLTTIEIMEIVDIAIEKANKLSDFSGYKITKGISSSGVFEAIIAFGSEGYKIEQRDDLYTGQKAIRMFVMGTEAYATDLVSTTFGVIIAIPSASLIPEAPAVGLAVGYGVGSSASSVIIEDWLNRQANPLIFPIIGLGEYQ